MFVKLTLRDSKEPILVNLDTVTAFSKNFNEEGCLVVYAEISVYDVAESLDEIQALISARIMNP